MIINGDCLEELKKIPENSIDSLITDPPAGISFMGKEWDGDRGGREHWIAWMTEVMKECHRVLKPGAHGLVWAIPRTSHWTATALENAGFEVRDVVTHIFGTGFPKSLNIGEGRGTALKPASEHWILVRKPIEEKTVAANVLKYGTGGLNIDGSRIPGVIGPDRSLGKPRRTDNDKYGKSNPIINPQSPLGRFPANLVLSCSPYCTEDQHDIECVIKELDEQSGILKTHGGGIGEYKGKGFFAGGRVSVNNQPKDSGGASRFFYCAKASKSDKGSDNSHPTVKSTKLMEYLIKLITPPGGTVLDPFMGSGSTGVASKKLGFNFVGIEKNEAYFEISQKRVLCQSYL